MSTDELTNELKKCDDIDAFMDENNNEFNEDAFKEFLGDLLTRNKLNKTKLATEVGMSTSYISELFSGEKNAPGKDKLLQISFGLKLTLDETNRLLVLGGRAHLRSKLRRDAIVIYSIEKGFSLEQADDLLYHYNQPTISSQK
jgi:transcriptional regulator with XRE-family HTH domain